MLSRQRFVVLQLSALSLIGLLAACTSPEERPVTSPASSLVQTSSSASLGGAASAGVTASAQPSPARVDAPPSSTVMQKICQTRYVDESSHIFPAKKNGAVTRWSVTPSNRMADMGNLIFDADGNHLGNDMGGELPWEDKAFMAKERERVAKLMDGAEVERDAAKFSCDGKP